MSLFLATLLPGLLLVFLGFLFLASTPAIVSTLKALPRSKLSTGIFFGGGALWFLHVISHLGEADFGQYRTYLTLFFALLAVGAFFYVPDFLAVRGLAILVLLSASPLLAAAYMEYEYPARLTLVSLVYILILLALYLGAAPYRLRDFLEWLYLRPVRARIFGASLVTYGLVLGVVAFTY